MCWEKGSLIRMKRKIYIYILLVLLILVRSINYKMVMVMVMTMIMMILSTDQVMHNTNTHHPTRHVQAIPEQQSP